MWFIRFIYNAKLLNFPCYLIKVVLHNKSGLILDSVGEAVSRSKATRFRITWLHKVPKHSLTKKSHNVLYSNSVFEANFEPLNSLCYEDVMPVIVIKSVTYAINMFIFCHAHFNMIKIEIINYCVNLINDSELCLPKNQKFLISSMILKQLSRTKYKGSLPIKCRLMIVYLDSGHSLETFFKRTRSFKNRLVGQRETFMSIFYCSK